MNPTVVWMFKYSFALNERIYIYKAEKPSVCLSVCLSVRRVDISAVSAWIDIKFAWNEVIIIWQDEVYF